MADLAQELTDCLKTIIKHMVDHEDNIEVTPAEVGSTIVFYIRVAKTDLGRLIGKNGKTISSLEYLVSRWAGKYQMRISLEVDKLDEKNNSQRTRKDEEARHWQSQQY